MNKLRGKTAIVGIGEVPTGRYPDKGAIYFAAESSRQAIKDAGINKDDIDLVMPIGVLFSPNFLTQMSTGRLVEELGLKNVKTNELLFSGGSSGCGMHPVGIRRLRWVES